MVDAERFFDESALALVGTAIRVEVEGLAKDAERRVIRVERAVDDRGEEPFRIVAREGFFDDALAGAGLADEEAESALLAVDAEGVHDLLLMRQERVFAPGEGVLVEAEVSADHERAPFFFVRGLRSLARRSTGLASPMRSPL